MIWIWINAIVAGFKAFFLPPSFVVQREDPNEVCPSCGHRNGFITSVQKSGKFLVQHDCRVCKAQWWKLPVFPDQIAADSTQVKIAAPVEIAPTAPKE